MYTCFNITLSTDDKILIELIVKKRVVGQMKCELHIDVPFCLRNLGRDYDKFRKSDSKTAEWFRMQQSSDTPKGKVWYFHAIDKEWKYF